MTPAPPKAPGDGRARGQFAIGAALVALFVATLKLYFFPYTILDADSQLLVNGARALETCLQTKAVVCAGVQHFPVLQYLEAIVLFHSGLDFVGVLHGFASVSALSFFGAALAGALFLWRHGRRSAAIFFAVAILSSYALWHFNSTYSESLAALLGTLFVASAFSRRWPVLLGVLAFAGTLTKETAAPFVLALGLLPLLRAEGTWRERLRRELKLLVALVLGVLAGVVVHALFNRLRFGTVTNTFLLDPQLQVPSLGEQLLQFAALWVAPNGGLLWFAPLATIGLVALAWVGWKSGGPRAHRLAAVVPLALMVVATLGFARWFSPFGWWTWGPRLCLPWVAPLLLAALALEAERLEALLQRVLRPWPVALGLALVVIAASLPNLAMLPAADLFYGFFEGNVECPRPIDVRSGQPEAFYACTRAMAFPRQHFLLLKTYPKLLEPNVRLAAALYAALLGMLLIALRRALRAESRSP